MDNDTLPDAPAACTAYRDLVVCCDGTNNTLTGGVEDTNVLLLYSYLLRKVDRRNTVLFYDPGVGTPDAAPPTDLIDLAKRRADRIAGLASGRGVYDNIAEAYRFLMNHWQGPADRIFCFGFSRGAFTARCVVGMVNMFGVIRPEHEALLPTLIRIYFSQPSEEEQTYGRKNIQRSLARLMHTGFARPAKAGSETAQPSEESTTRSSRKLLAQQVRRSFGIDDPALQASVHWVGVWDTVESVGFPILFSRDNPATASFQDKPGIRNVRHALAFDEHRLPFLPRLYDEPSELTLSDARGKRTFKQLWFPGVHCDVGGSYTIDSSGLADRAWLWMFNEVAPEFGLPQLAQLPSGGKVPYDDLGMPRRATFPNARLVRHDALWDTPWWALAGMTVRRMEPQHVATNAQAKAAKEGHKSIAGVGVLVDVKAASAPTPLKGPSVWDKRRKWWPAALALVVAAAGLVLSGWCLDDPKNGLAASATSRPACHFAMQQLASLVSPTLLPPALARWENQCGPVASIGLRDAVVWQTYLQRSPVSGMLWDLLAIVGIGYLLARVSSRSFTFLAGFSEPGQKRSALLSIIGVFPVIAVLSDIGEDLLTLIAIALERLNAPFFVPSLLVMVGLFSLAKVVFYVASFGFFGLIRLALTVWPSSAVGKVGRMADSPRVNERLPA